MSPDEQGSCFVSNSRHVTSLLRASGLSACPINTKSEREKRRITKRGRKGSRKKERREEEPDRVFSNRKNHRREEKKRSTDGKNGSGRRENGKEGRRWSWERERKDEKNSWTKKGRAKSFQVMFYTSQASLAKSAESTTPPSRIT